MIKAQWKQLSEKTAALTLREKGIICAGLLLAIVWLNGFYIIMPLMEQIAGAQKTIEANRKQTTTVQKQVSLYQGALGKDPNTSVNKSITATETEIQKIDQLLSQLTVNFISPHKMREVLTELLKNDNNVKVTAFSAMAAEKINIAGVPVNADITIYQHGIRLTLKGSYFDLQQYMQRVEQLPWQFNWKTFSYRVEQHPDATLEIEITTISTNERFIAI